MECCEPAIMPDGHTQQVGIGDCFVWWPMRNAAQAAQPGARGRQTSATRTLTSSSGTLIFIRSSFTKAGCGIFPVAFGATTGTPLRSPEDFFGWSVARAIYDIASARLMFDAKSTFDSAR